MIVSSPYFHVQAIRRRYRDEGKPTRARPGGYALNLNFPAAGASTDVLMASLTVDSDSDFVWTSSYFYEQVGPWDPNVAANGEEATSAGDLQITLGWTGEKLSTPGFIQPQFFDRGASSFGGTDGFGSTEALEAEGAAQGMSPGIWRMFWPEPITIPAAASVTVELSAGGFVVHQGNILFFSGVRLYVGGQ